MEIPSSDSSAPMLVGLAGYLMLFKIAILLAEIAFLAYWGVALFFAEIAFLAYWGVALFFAEIAPSPPLFSDDYFGLLYCLFWV